MKKIWIDPHTHTVMSGHAFNTLTEMARHASDIGLPAIGITEHGPKTPGAPNYLYFLNYKSVPKELFGVQVMTGVELNILGAGGETDLLLCDLENLDIVVASIHIALFEGDHKDPKQVTGAYLKAMENPYVMIIGHPDDGRTPIDYEALVKGAKEHHVLLEVNASSLHPDSRREHAKENYETMLSFCKELDVPVIMSSDAHFYTHIAQFDEVERLFSRLAFPDRLVANYDRDLYMEFLGPRGAISGL